MYEITLDTETTGLPITLDEDGYPDHTINAFYNKSRIVQIAWIITENNKLISGFNYYIKPDNWIIENTHIHGITQQKCIEDGILITDVFKILNESINKCKRIIGHNIKFDIAIIKNELYRVQMTENIKALDNLEIVDTMYLSMIIFKLEYRPRLIELYEKIFNMKFPAHNALYDILACNQCFQRMLFGMDLIV